MIASKGVIRISNSDGSYTEMGFEMPKEVSEQLLFKVASWKDDWTATVSEIEKYQEESLKLKDCELR